MMEAWGVWIEWGGDARPISPPFAGEKAISTAWSSSAKAKRQKSQERGTIPMPRLSPLLQNLTFGFANSLILHSLPHRGEILRAPRLQCPSFSRPCGRRSGGHGYGRLAIDRWVRK